MLAANLDPTQFSSSHPLILSIAAMALEKSAFVWMTFSISNLSSTKDCHNFLYIYSIVHLAPSLHPAYGQTLLVFSLTKIFLSSRASVVKGRIVYGLCMVVLQSTALGANPRTSWEITVGAIHKAIVPLGITHLMMTKRQLCLHDTTPITSTCPDSTKCRYCLQIFTLRRTRTLCRRYQENRLGSILKTHATDHVCPSFDCPQHRASDLPSAVT